MSGATTISGATVLSGTTTNVTGTTTLSGATTATKRIKQVLNATTGFESVNGYYGLAKNAQPLPNPSTSGVRAIQPLNLYTTPVSVATNYEYMCWSPEAGVFCTASRSGGNSTTQIITSRDGMNWSYSPYTVTTNTGWPGAYYGGGKIIVFQGSNDANTLKVMYTTDAINWNLASTPTLSGKAFQGIAAVAYSPQLNRWMAALSTTGISSAAEQLMTSGDGGLSWTECTVVTPLALSQIRSMCWSAELGMFVIIRSGGNQHYYSTDGVNILNGPVQSFSMAATSGIAWSPSLGIFSIGANTTQRIVTSTDGLNFVSQNTPTLTDSLNQLLWIPSLGMFVGVLSAGTGNRIAWSYDGINYTRGTTPSDLSYSGCAYSLELGVFTSVASGSVAARVMTSSLSGRPPTSYNTFNSPFNNIDANGNWQLKARNIYTDTGSTISVSSDTNVSGALTCATTNVTGALTCSNTTNVSGALTCSNTANFTASTTLSTTTATKRVNQVLNAASTYESVNGYYALDKQKQPIPTPLVNGARAVSTWNYQTAATNNNWMSVCWAPELSLAVAVSSSGTGNRVQSSSNLISWTSRSSAADVPWQCVAYGGPVGNKKFVAVSAGGTVMWSSTGITWTSSAAPALISYSCCYSSKIFG